jgi:3-hydroxyisobutyrate dehydrogenase-like beta-hydroxyacid dehydrogenase
MSYQIGYIGLGALGSAIAPNLATFAQQSSLQPISLWNRTTEKYESLKPSFPSDAHFAEVVEELVERCNVIFTCLVNDQADEDVYAKLVARLKEAKGKRTGQITFIDQSTIKPATAGEPHRARFPLEVKLTGL